MLNRPAIVSTCAISALKNTSSFVKSPADAVVDLYEQYVHDLEDVLDKHAPLISRLKKKDSADWVSDSYQRAKSLRCQFERTWHRTKNSLNRSRLHHHIARCNSLVNKDKSDYYSKLISDNSQDLRKLWHVLRKTLSKVSEMTLVLYCVFILSAISPYTTGLKALFNQSDCTGTAPTHK